MKRCCLLLTALLCQLASQISWATEAEAPAPERFHLYLLIGQSNMAGRGALENPPPAVPARVLKLDRENKWVPAVEPLHFDNPKIVGAGLGFSFAEAMAEANPDVTIGLIPCAVGGTPLSRWEKGCDLYRQAVERAKQGMKQGTLKGILWHQGEQDSLDLKLTETYADRLVHMVRDLRAELNVPEVPFVAGELGKFLTGSFQGKLTYPVKINEQTHLAGQSIPYFAVVSSSGLKSKQDLVHFDTPALREFGRRYAAAMQQLQSPSSLKIATFNVDATPALGSPGGYAKTRKIEDPLSARGIVILGANQPVVLCAVDWIVISNSGHTLFREKLAEAAGTTADHVAVHVLHQHDSPICDFRAEEILEESGLGGTRLDSPFCRHVIESAADAVRKAIPQAQPVTHLGIGKANVEKVASNRRILGPDGKVKIVRFSSSKDPAAQEAPEGVIDPELKLISFWNNDKPLVSLTYYATHPQSYYGKGDVTAEFVGLARARREAALPDMAHIHFNGAGGNVASGKYNDGSPQMRTILTDRMEEGMKRAWDATIKQPITADGVKWRFLTVNLPVSKRLKVETLRNLIKEKHPSLLPFAASKLAWLERNTGDGVPIELSCLKIGNVCLLQMPGELFVEYQLAAQQMRPDKTVCMAAYGDCSPGYVGTEVAYSQGGYETGELISNVSPKVEKVLMDGIRELLK